MSPSQRRETISVSPWFTAACRNSDDTASGIDIMRPFMAASLDDLAVRHPTRAVEPRELLGLEREEVVGPGVHLDPGARERQLQVLQVRRLLHHVLAREVVAALLEHLHQRLRGAVA